MIPSFKIHNYEICSENTYKKIEMFYLYVSHDLVAFCNFFLFFIESVNFKNTMSCYMMNNILFILNINYFIHHK